jgi:hypothetical protein
MIDEVSDFYMGNVMYPSPDAVFPHIESAETRDGNSSENFTSRGIGESRNGDLTFLGDRGR